MVSDDVAAILAEIATEHPLNGMVEMAGPEKIRQDELVRQFLRVKGDERKVVTNPNSLYFGTRIDDQSLTPGPNPRLGPTRLDDWLKS